MAEEQVGQEEVQNTSQEQTSSQNQEYYKAFTEEEWKTQQDKFYRGAYNQGKEKVFKDLTTNLGVEAEDFDELITKLKSSGQEKQSKKSDAEVEELRQMVQEYQEKANEFQTALEKERFTQSVNNAAKNAFTDLDLTIGQDDVLALYFAQNQVEGEDGSYYAIVDGKPELGDDGQRKPLTESIRDFVRTKGLIKSSAQGAGGATGGGASVKKPSRQDYRDALRSKDNKRADYLWGLKKQFGGWAEE